MSKHTPGNWVAKPIDSADWIDLVTDDPETCGYSAHSLPFASCRHFNQEANARLIAAAPDLLAAAKLVIDWYEAEDDHSKADFYQRLEMCRESEAALRAAIAKATGEQP